MSAAGRTNNLARTGNVPLARLFPMSDMAEFRHGMDDLFNRWLGESPFGPSGASSVPSLQPAVDLWETPEAYVMNVAVPGVNLEDLELEVTGETISIKGERKPTGQEKNVILHVQNIGYGRFQVAYTLPAPIDAQGVKADYRDGILVVTLPKQETAKTRTIKVNVSQPQK